MRVVKACENPSKVILTVGDVKYGGVFRTKGDNIRILIQVKGCPMLLDPATGNAWSTEHFSMSDPIKHLCPDASLVTGE